MLTEEIIKGLLENDQNVIRYIYKNYFKVVNGFVISNRGSEQDAWDVFQESLILVFEKLRQDPTCIRSSFHGYLYGVCKYRWIKRLNEMVRDHEQSEIDLNDDYYPQLEFLQIMNDIETLAVKESRERIFQEGYLSLKQDCRRLIDLVINGCTIEEITDYMNFTSVKYAFRKRQKCKERLMEYIKTRIN
jgi:DNA-directed RNA polymerase specialized sigma24 family protein